MKKFPRLHSLTTLGIRQHQEFDYMFHGFRTDFVGDSGCGKSMIADLIQLVFVGSEQFRSATESVDKREVDGMVLKTAESRGTDIAYILVNIEINECKYVVVGAYLDSSSRTTKSFVIQADWDEEALMPMPRAISVEDIYIKDQIPTLEGFKQEMEDNGFVYQGFSQRKKFHAYLYKHQLLSIDLSQSNQVLKDYAVIIQSFSRGKGLNIGESGSLKSFLFGDEKAKEITDKYKKAVEELQITLKEYSQNRKDIELVRTKHQALKIVRGFKDALDAAEVNWLERNCAYLHQQERENYTSFYENAKDYIDGIFILKVVYEILQKEIEREFDTLTTLRNREIVTKEVNRIKLVEYLKWEPVKNIRQELKCGLGEIKDIYYSYHKEKQRSDLIQKVEKELHEQKLTDTLLDFDEFHEITDLVTEIDSRLASTMIKLNQKQGFLTFTDIKNKGTLGNWAIKNYKPYSREVESILMFYKALGVEAPLDKAVQYLVTPTKLLQDDVVFEKENEGFWITAGELRQYIPYVGQQLFTTENEGKLEEILASFSGDLTVEIQSLFTREKLLQFLKKFVLKTSGFSEYLLIEKTAKTFENIESLNISKSDFERGMALQEKSELLETEMESAEQALKASLQSLSDYKRLIGTFKMKATELKNSLYGEPSGTILKNIYEIFNNLSQRDKDQSQHESFCYLRYSNTSEKEQWLEKIVNDNIEKIEPMAIGKQFDGYEKAKSEKEVGYKQARFVMGREPDISLWKSGIIDNPIEEEKIYVVSKRVYESKFGDIVSEFASGDAYKFKDNYNFLELCTAILPEAFLEEQIQQDTSIEVIEQFFMRINEKNKNLNTRKLQKIREILDEVSDEVNKRHDTIRQIHNFLNHKEREITGGHRAALHYEVNSDYPKGWIDSYIDKLEQENTLFAVGETLEDLLRDSVSLEEKMINAFHAFGGHKGVKPKVEDLLNPNSYFKLNFRIESHATKRSNSGSTGQTYAAIALLCIARLSLVNKSSFNKNPPKGIRFMPIDEAEGLGSNFDMLYEIAGEFDYQIITMSINPLGKFKEGAQYIYMLSNNKEVPEDVNYPPLGIFCDADQI
jgi:ABC-type dipeptide/oligopeptide/nickel transport system ATPase component